jgi:adenine deaminase
VGFITGFGLKQGAIAQTIAHDSHNIVAIGTSDTEIVDAINELIKLKGGIVINTGKNLYKIPLNFAGLMTDIDPFELAEKYKFATKLTAEMGTTLRSPFMTLAFMPLLVIPKLKIGDKGLFDVEKFSFTDLFSE